jgi:LmbE family N-acetylglucosaminyl deacetylase
MGKEITNSSARAELKDERRNVVQVLGEFLEAVDDGLLPRDDGTEVSLVVVLRPLQQLLVLLPHRVQLHPNHILILILILMKRS